jgi:hypothetical protein
MIDCGDWDIPRRLRLIEAALVRGTLMTGEPLTPQQREYAERRAGQYRAALVEIEGRHKAEQATKGNDDASI